MMPVKDNEDESCFLVTKLSPWRGRYKRIFSVGTTGVTTYNPSTLEITNRWPYCEFVAALPGPSSSPTQTNSAGLGGEFTISARSKKSSMRFSCEYRADLITDLLTHRNQFCGAEKQRDPSASYSASKVHWLSVSLPVTLQVAPAALEQRDPTTNVLVASYNYKDLAGMRKVIGCPGSQGNIEAWAIEMKNTGRMHLFLSSDWPEIKQKMQKASNHFLGITLILDSNRSEIIQWGDWNNFRLGKYSGDESLTPIAEFSVQKSSPRHSEPVRRVLCLSETCLIDRDPQTYQVCSVVPLESIFCLIRPRDSAQSFTVQLDSGQRKQYSCHDRDSVLASLLDTIRAAGNRNAHVSSYKTSRAYRLLPLWATVDEEMENFVLKLVQTPLADRPYLELLERFNANVPYSGLQHITIPAGIFAENKDKRVTGALETMMLKEGDLATLPLSELEAQFNALRRLLACKVGFCSFTSLTGLRENIGMRVVKSLRRNDEAVAQLALELVCALMVPLHQTWDLRQEQLNKASLLSSPKFLASLLDMWAGHVMRGTGALVVTAMLDVLTFALCAPYSETTNGGHFDQLLGALADRGRCLYKLFQHPCLAIVRGAGLCMKALIEEGPPEVGSKMQHLALSEGALPRHLQSALYLRGPEPRTLALRQLSRHLVALWCVNNPDADSLLARILPSGLLFMLESDEKAVENSEDYINFRDNLKLVNEDSENMKPSGIQQLGITVQKNLQKNLKVVEKHVEHALQHWGARMGLERLGVGLSSGGDSVDNSNQPRPVVLRKRRELVKSKANWLLLYSKFWHDHSQPDLIWNHRTREELRESLQQELASFTADAELASSTQPDAANLTISWNHREFEVVYGSLSDEIKIGDYYLRLLLERDHEATLQASLGQGTAVGSGIKKASELFTELYHRFLLSSSRADMRAMCLQAMSIVYGQHYEELGPFPDTKFLVAMLDKSIERPERDRLVLFLRQLARHRLNARPLLEASVVRSLVDLVTLAHLHTSRAMVPSQSNVIEAGPGMTRDQEKEWFYEVANERKGPVSYKELKELFAAGTITARTKCWAQGMEAWRQLHQVPQLKWGLLARGEPVLDESQLAHLALGILTQLCEYSPSREEDGSVIRPLPRVKRQISDPSCLPHIVQLLLTFDPRLVESVASLLTFAMADNPSVSCLYMTGAFFFVLMYTGSNVLPIARFLSTTHTLQACSRVQQGGGSVLSPLLPEAMVHFLVNHGPERFAEIFLGEFDTPEAIWSSEMRRHLCERLSAHLSDFTPRLASNTRAIYSHCAIPVVSYPQLETELFCGSFYLRHLCDEAKFPNWPIPQPVELLREVLLAWKKEVEKKPPAMSVEEAYTELGLSTNKQPDEAAVRKAYYILAQKFHPDKNPEGRDKFEAVNKAYEFLCSRVSRDKSGPNPENIVLILRAQSILFRRYKKELSPYKYAGYPQLVKTIRMETWDEALFSKQAPLLSSASELAYHTVDCCALNAEELRREGGIDALLEALSRCVAVLGLSSKPQDCAVKVCCSVVQTLAVCAKSQACRDKMVELPRLVWEVCAVLQWQHLGELACHATACVASLAADSILQMALVQCGALWPALSAMFGYDYTLEEGGVATTEGASSQAVANKLARLSLEACAALSGFPPLPSNGAAKDTNSEKEEKPDYPSNPVAQNALEKLLTSYIARKLGRDSSDQILKTLTSNSENPYLIWDNGTRAQLMEFVEVQRKIRRDPGDPIDPSIDLAPEFDFSAHEEELVVGGVFIRVYNEQPSFPIENPKGFVIELLEFLKAQSSSLQLSPGDDKPLKHAHMALESLSNVLKNNKGVELQLIGHFRLLAWLLGLPKLQPECLKVLNTACTNQECVTDIAASEIIHNLFFTLLGSNPEVLCPTLDCIHGLASSPKAVKEALYKGAVLYLLNLFCSSEANAEVRSRSAELLSRLSSDRLSGPRVKLALSRLLPISLADLVLASPRMALGVYDGTHENPELVWGPGQRQRLEAHLVKMQSEFSAKQKLDPKSEWKPPDHTLVLDVDDKDELVIGGVYLRLYASNPGWTLKRPKLFLGELLDTTINLMAKESGDSPKLELAVNSLVGLLTSQPTLAEALPSLGHLPKVIQTLSGCVDRNHSQAAVGAVKVLLQLSKSQACVEALRSTECVGTMKMAMQKYPQAQAPACETFSNWFSCLGAEHIARQAVQVELVPYLLSLLQSASSPLSSANKAHVVQALKALRNSSNQQLAEKVAVMLDRCPGWAEYRDQKHDLFLAGGQEHAYLTGAPAGMAGYLTDGRGSAKLPDQPPPLHSPPDTPGHR